jgi:hypothetical protein
VIAIVLVPKSMKSESHIEELFAMRSYILGLAVSVAIALPSAAQTGEVAAASGRAKWVSPKP